MKTTQYKIPSYIVTPQDRFEVITNIVRFLIANNLPIHATWRGKIKDDDQRILFGRTFGKRTLTLDGFKETITGTRKVCFGNDFDDCVYWDLKTGELTINCEQINSAITH